jgi:hypothetical protein
MNQGNANYGGQDMNQGNANYGGQNMNQGNANYGGQDMNQGNANYVGGQDMNQSNANYGGGQDMNQSNANYGGQNMNQGASYGGQGMNQGGANYGGQDFGMDQDIAGYGAQDNANFGMQGQMDDGQMDEKKMQRKGHKFVKSKAEFRNTVYGFENLAKEGVLKKSVKGIFGTSFQERYFAVTGHYLKYFADEGKRQGDQVKGAIDLGTVLDVRVGQAGGNEDTNTVDITLAEGDVLTLQTQTVEEAYEWVSALLYAKSQSSRQPSFAPGPSYITGRISNEPIFNEPVPEVPIPESDMISIRVTVPFDLPYDRTMEVQAPDGRVVEVQVPDGLAPGTEFVFQVPPEERKQGFFARLFGFRAAPAPDRAGALDSQQTVEQVRQRISTDLRVFSTDLSVYSTDCSVFSTDVSARDQPSFVRSR